jgi:hypothetical protein
MTTNASDANQPFTLAVCSEMVFRDLPIIERIKKIDELGFQVEIWDWTKHDIKALANSGATFSSMTGYVTGTLADDEGADELLCTANVPCPAGFGDGELGAVFDELVGPALRRFAPDFVLVSAGFDCDGRDPLGGLRLTPAGIAKMARVCADAAREVAGGRLVAVLEGGYDLEALSDGVRTVLQEWQGGDQPVPAPVTGDGRRAAPLVEHLQRLHAPA